MADTSLPVPQGATFAPLPAASTPQALPVPKGATFAPVGQKPQMTPQMADQQKAIDAINPDKATGLAGVVTGAAKAVTGSMKGILNLAGKTATLGLDDNPTEKMAPAMSSVDTQPKNFSQGAGGFVENAAEFLAGDEVLKSLAELPAAAKYIQSAEGWYKYFLKNPMAQKAAEAFGRIARYSSLGAGQGAVHGAETGQAAEGALHGAEAGALGAGTGELAGLAGKGAQIVGKKVSEAAGNLPVADLALKAFRPGVREMPKFLGDFTLAAPRLAAENSVQEFKDMEEVGEAANRAKNSLWSDEIKPMVEKNAHEVLDVRPASDAVLNIIKKNPALEKYSPAEAKKLADFALNFNVPQTLEQVENDIEHLNAEITDTGFWKKTPQEKAAALKVNGDLSGKVAAADSLRDMLYQKLTDLGERGSQEFGEQNIEELKKTYGALTSLEGMAKRMHTVYGRSVPVSLKQMLGAVGALAGGPKAWIAGALPIADKLYNSPANMVVRALTEHMNPSGPGKLAQTAEKVIANSGKIGGTIGASVENHEGEEK